MLTEPSLILFSRMLKMIVPGYNESVQVGDVLFHVQTEHHEVPGSDYIETQVFKDGKIVLTRRFERARQELQRAQGKRLASDQKLAGQLRHIHQGVIEKLRLGKLRQNEKSVRSIHDDRNLRKNAIRFLRAVGNEVPGSDITLRMRSIANIMALIAGQRSSRALRHDDLEQLLRFREEAIHLVKEAEPDVQRGHDLWRRMAATAGRLSRVNDRRKLIESDAAVCRRFLHHSLAGPDPEGHLESEEIQDLRLIWGRDQILDQMLDEPAKLTKAAVKHELLRILEQLEYQLGAPGQRPN